MSVEAEKVLRRMLSNVGTSNEEVDRIVQIARGETYGFLQVIERCLERKASAAEKARQQTVDEHRSKK